VEILIQFLMAHLPAALLAEVGSLAAVVVAAVALMLKYVPWAKRQKRWFAPLLSLLLGMAAGFVTVGLDTSQVPLALALGLLITLTAIGSHSSGKNIGQVVSNVRQSKKKVA
jgi:hypothetical protein